MLRDLYLQVRDLDPCLHGSLRGPPLGEYLAEKSRKAEYPSGHPRLWTAEPYLHGMNAKFSGLVERSLLILVGCTVVRPKWKRW